jgi:flagellar biosynthetic protein FlhB
MAEESGQERSLPATERRIEKAREEGRVPRSVELATLAVLCAALGALWAFGPAMFGSLKSVMADGLTLDRRAAFDSAVAGERLVSLGLQGFAAVLPLVAAISVAAVLAPLAVGGWVMSYKAVEPQFSRIDPLAGIGRMFSVHGLLELSKAVLKAVLLGGAGALFIWSNLPAVAALSAEPAGASLMSAGGLVVRALVPLALVMLIIAATDVPAQIYRYRVTLRMSLQEVREENRESEGDPQIRARIRSQQQAVARRRMMSAVPKADVVVTNPTHYAVALAYQDGSFGAPRVLAKGTGEVALRIRAIAAEAGVPLLEAPPLARALHATVDIGGEIPAALYDAVAMVLAWVYQLRGRGGPALPPADLPVPAGLDPEAPEARGTA